MCKEPEDKSALFVQIKFSRVAACLPGRPVNKQEGTILAVTSVVNDI
jgi:hypothetical protein